MKWSSQASVAAPSSLGTIISLQIMPSARDNMSTTGFRIGTPARRHAGAQEVGRGVGGGVVRQAPLGLGVEARPQPGTRLRATQWISEQK